MRRNQTGMLAKQLRLKLTGDGDDIPRAYQNLIVSVHAVATFKAIDEYLRPRISRTTLEARDKLRATTAGFSRRRKTKDSSPSVSGANTPQTSSMSDLKDSSSMVDEETVASADSTTKGGTSEAKPIEPSDIAVSYFRVMWSDEMLQGMAIL
jgi:E3 ubiquitin-protein ligase TRIP12